MLCYVISHVPGVLKGFQDQLFYSEFILCALILQLRNPLWVCGREALLSPARSLHAQRWRPRGLRGGLRSRASRSHIYCASSSEGSKPSCTSQTPLTAASAAQTLNARR